LSEIYNNNLLLEVPIMERF